MLSDWENWTSHALSSSPSWKSNWLDNVREFHTRINRAVWPHEIPDLESALISLSLNLAMASRLFSCHCELREAGWYRGEKFYKSMGWNENYHRDLNHYERWLARQVNFLEKATRSANWLAAVVRRTCDARYYAVPGKFVITSSSGGVHVLEYSESEKLAEPKASQTEWDKIVKLEKKGARIY
jgi:hypothetical protein